MTKTNPSPRIAEATRSTMRLTTAQAIVRYLAAQHSVRDGQRQRLVPAMLGIFGHGNVAGLGQALDEYQADLPFVQGRNEQSLVHIAAGYAKANRRTSALAVTASIGPGAANMVTGAALATVNRLPVLLFPGDVYATRRQGPVLQQLEHPTSGDVSVGGLSLSELSRNERAALRRRVIGYVFQDFNLLAGLTAAENVALPLELDGVPARKARVAGLAVLEDLGLAERAASFPDQLSGGERQRVAIARAVVGERQLLLADEPSGALDSVNGEAVMRLIHAACKRGVAAVVVTHDAQLASWADRVVFLRDGRVTDQTLPVPGPESLLTRGSGQ